MSRNKYLAEISIFLGDENADSSTVGRVPRSPAFYARVFVHLAYSLLLSLCRPLALSLGFVRTPAWVKAFTIMSHHSDLIYRLDRGFRLWGLSIRRPHAVFMIVD